MRRPLPPSGVRARSVLLPMYPTASQLGALLQRNSLGLMLRNSPLHGRNETPSLSGQELGLLGASLAPSGASANCPAVLAGGAASVVLDTADEGGKRALPLGAQVGSCRCRVGWPWYEGCGPKGLPSPKHHCVPGRVIRAALPNLSAFFF